MGPPPPRISIRTPTSDFPIRIGRDLEQRRTSMPRSSEDPRVPCRRSSPLRSCLAAAPRTQTGPDQWSDPPGAPAPVAGGGGVVATDANILYALFGGGTTGFSATRPPPLQDRDALSGAGALPQAPWTISDGGAMAFLPETTSIYVLRGGATKSFSDTNTASNSGRTFRTSGTRPLLQLAAAAGNIYAMAGAADKFFEFSPPLHPPTAPGHQGRHPRDQGYGCALAYRTRRGIICTRFEAHSPIFLAYASADPRRIPGPPRSPPVPQAVARAASWQRPSPAPWSGARCMARPILRLLPGAKAGLRSERCRLPEPARGSPVRRLAFRHVFRGAAPATSGAITPAGPSPPRWPRFRIVPTGTAAR